MRIEPAAVEAVPCVMQILTRCTQSMREQGIHQWDEIYPDLKSVYDDARSRSLFVAREGDSCVGSICLTADQPEEYRLIPWTYTSGRALVVHRLCVHPERQGQGVARQLMDFTEQFAQSEGYACIRLNAYSGNSRSIKLYQRRGYQRARQVHFPRRALPFICFELRTDRKGD